MKPRLLEIRQGVLSKNDELAAQLREKFKAANIFVLNLVSSPGAGKTYLLEQTLVELQKEGYKVAALVGDLETDNDAQRLAQSGAPVNQIETAGTCHLEAHMVEHHLADWELNEFDFLFIENVGNLVCPASFDLGENLRVVLLSTTEGEDKPLKYPPMFNSSDVCLITKIDIAEALEFDRQTAYDSIEAVRPGLPVYEVSAKTGQGMADWIDFLIHKREKISPLPHNA